MTDYVTVRDLRTKAGAVWQSLEAERQLVLTNNGRPIAIMLKVDGATVHETLDQLSRVAAIQAMHRVQALSVHAGNSDMTMDQINAEIALARRDRRDHLAGASS
ncbi:MAG: hypothetical protein LBK59_11360 [Bifidobacteriaceae bacterium]|jgi:antitoxin (DNA-binding transcriptional repressor) of toxin-antitoxin stability system|nr:hypothetical protein [Bifidobacteriaceae bacterium]